MTARPLYLAPALAVAVLSGIGCSVDLQAGVASATGRFERRLVADGPVDLEVTTGSGGIDIRRSDGKEVVVVGTIRANRGFWNSESADDRVRRIEANPPVRQNGNAIRVGDFDDSSLRRNVSISYEILVPGDTTVRSRTGSGSQRIDSVNGRVDAETGSGSIRVGRVGGTVAASTGSGSIEVMGAEGLMARTGSGSIEASGIVGGVRAHTGSGGVRIEGTPTGDWTVRTGSGSIGLRLAGDAGFDIDARTSSGGISTSHPIELRGSVSRNHLQGRVRGGGARIEATAGSGSIRLD
jgi:hypothetical protein